MRTAAPFVAVVLAAAGLAHAQDTVEVRRIGEGQGRIITLFGSQVGNFYTFQIGELTHEFRNGIGEGQFLTGTLQTFCTDLTQDSSFNWETYNVVPLSNAPNPGPAMGAAKAQALADVWFGAAGQQFSSPDYAAAFQMIVWDIVYDYDGTAASVSTTAGTVQFNSPAAYYSTVTGIFAQLKTFIGSNAPVDGLRAVSHPLYQDQVVIVPTPGSAALLAAGLGLGMIRRRR